MSSIRLSGTTSGYYDLTVPAAAGTNSIDLSNLPVKDSSNNLNITGKLGVGNTTPHGTYLLKVGPVNTTETIAVQSAGGGSETIMQSVSGSDSRIGSSANTPLNLITNNVSRMTIDTSGRVTTPNQPGMNVFANNNNSGAYNNSANNNQFCIWTGVRYNIGNHYNTSNGNFTCPVAGKYFVSFHSNWYNSGAGSWIMIQVYKNSAVQEQWYHATIAGASWMNEAGSTVLDCAANDTIALYKQTQSGSGGGADIGNYSGFVVRLLG